MKRILALTMTMALAAMMSLSYGQDLKKFMKKRADKAGESATERVGKEADKAVSKEVNKALDKIFGSQSDEETETTSESEQNESSATSTPSTKRENTQMDMGGMLKSMGISTGTANVKDSYNFDGFIEMTITNFEDGKQEDEALVYKTYLDSKTLDYGLEYTGEDNEDVALIIFDSENSLMLTLSETDGEKTGFAMGFSPEDMDDYAEDMDEEGDTEVEDSYEMYKTGKTKKILGYTCSEYRIEDEAAVTTMWITKDLNKELKKNYLHNTTFTGMFVHAYYTDGMVMEYIFEDLEDDEKSVMTVTDLDLNYKKNLSTGAYTIMNMGVMMEEAEEEEE